MNQNDNPQNTSWFRVLMSVLRAFCGIQTEKNRLHDFSAHSNPWPFIIVGIVLFLLFTAAIVWVARIVAY